MTARPKNDPHDVALAVVSALLVAGFAIPGISAAAGTRAGEIFSGFLALPADQHQYIAWMRDAATGDWLLANRYTAEGSGHVVVRPLFVLLGKVAGLFGADFRLIYEISRWVLGLAVIVALDRFFGLWIDRGRKRIATVVFAATTSGLGVLLYAAGVRWARFDGGDLPGFPAGHWWTDLYLGQHLVLLPHFVFAVLLLLLATTAMVRWWRGEASSPLWKALVPAAILAVEHPFDTMILLAWCGALGVVHAAARKDFRRTAMGYGALLAVTVPLVGGVSLLLKSDTGWARILDESLGQASPSPVLLILALGIPLVPALATAVCGADALRRGGDTLRRYETQAAVTALLTAALVLPYLPFGLQRRLALALTIPLCLAAAVSVGPLVGRAAAGATLVIVLSGLGTPLNIIDNLRYLEAAPPHERHQYYVSELLVDLLDEAETAHGKDHVVLCAPLDGMLVPAYSGLRVVLGHNRHTPGFAEKKAAWGSFVSPQTPHAERIALPRTLGADWVLLRIGGDRSDPRRSAEIAHYQRLRQEIGTTMRTVLKNPEWELLAFN